MEENSGKALYLHRIWLLLCAVCCAGISFFGERMPSVYRGKLFGILACVLMVILSLISLAAGDISVMGLLDQDKRSGLSPGRIRRLACAACAVFLAGTAAEAAYAVYGLRAGYADLMRDALTGAAIYTAGLLLAQKILDGMAGRELKREQ